MKKNRQYYRSRKKVLQYRKQDEEKTLFAMRVAMEMLISATQLAIVLSTPKPKFASGSMPRTQGDAIIFSEKGPETFYEIRNQSIKNDIAK